MRVFIWQTARGHIRICSGEMVLRYGRAVRELWFNQ
jgi:hypothetical protein